MDLLGLWVYKTLAKPRLILRTRQTAPTALALHRQMYTAFAEGDLNSIHKICAEGLTETFTNRIKTRGNRIYHWSLDKYISTPKVMADRASALPMKESGLRQAVVRIHSQQSLEIYDAQGNLVPGSGEPKELKEYFVIQKLLKEGREGPWLIWGTTEETTVEKLDSDLKAEKA
jgi:protein MBA1